MYFHHYTMSASTAPPALNLVRIAGRGMDTAKLRKQDKRKANEALNLARAKFDEHRKDYEGKDFVPTFAFTLTGGRLDYRVTDITATSAKIDVTRPTYDSSSRQLIDEFVMSYEATWVSS
jgi:hypothetical protein